MSATEERRFAVLRAIVSDYVAHHEPVSSKALLEQHDLGVSSATIRNDMAFLELEGYITHPHTSSGRVPTDLGYRHFVDKLVEVKPLSNPERRAISRFLESGVDLDDILRRSVQLLSQLTHQVAVIQYPILSAAKVRHVELVELGQTRLLMVLITDTGRVEQRIVELAEPLHEDDLLLMRNLFISAMDGKPLHVASQAVVEVAENAPMTIRDACNRLAAILVEILVDQRSERFAVGGASNLPQYAADFTALPGSFHSILEALEEQMVLLRLFSCQSNDKVEVKIGSENEGANIAGASVITTSYGVSHHMGNIGVMGPTRMNYPGSMASVLTVAQYVGSILAENA